MHRIIILLLTTVLLMSCQEKNNKITFNLATMSYELPDLYIPTDSAQFYFPDNFDSFTNECYSRYLFAMREPILFSDDRQSDTYRFVWLRTFHHPISIRIEKQQNIYLLTWKLCTGQGGYDPGRLTVAKQKQIDEITWENFKTLLNQADFWNMDTEIKTPGLDGSQWILEGKEAGKYHVVDRWTPENGAYYQCCNFLIELTDLTFNENDKKY